MNKANTSISPAHLLQLVDAFTKHYDRRWFHKGLQHLSLTAVLAERVA